MAAGGAEEHFAKKLANNDKKIRDKALNKLRAWIRSRPKDGPGKLLTNFFRRREQMYKNVAPLFKHGCVFMDRSMLKRTLW